MVLFLACVNYGNSCVYGLSQISQKGWMYFCRMSGDSTVLRSDPFKGRKRKVPWSEALPFFFSTFKMTGAKCKVHSSPIKRVGIWLAQSSAWSWSQVCAPSSGLDPSKCETQFYKLMNLERATSENLNEAIPGHISARLKYSSEINGVTNLGNCPRICHLHCIKMQIFT